MKKQYISIIILAILVALYFLVQHRQSVMVSPKSVENFLDVDTSYVDRVVISKLGSSITLTRAGGGWYVLDGDEARKADRTAVNQLMEIVGGMKAANVISDNPAKQISFQVDTLTGSTVSLYSGERLLSAVVIGKMADYMHTYVRLRAENEVYIAEGMMSHLFRRSLSDWRDKTILDIDPGQVQSVELKFGDEHYRISRTDTVWQISRAPFTEAIDADQDSAEKIVSSLCTLRANSFATAYDTTAYDFSEVGYSALISMADGSSRLLEAASADEDASRHFLRIPEDSSIFIILDATWQKIAQSVQELLPGEKNS